jgi:hypothetical protein
MALLPRIGCCLIRTEEQSKRDVGESQSLLLVLIGVSVCRGW